MLEWAGRSSGGLAGIATGHYAGCCRRRLSPSGRTQLPARPRWPERQSYFPNDLPQSVLERLVFPLGEISKADNPAVKPNCSGCAPPPSQKSKGPLLSHHHGSMKAFL